MQEEKTNSNEHPLEPLVSGHFCCNKEMDAVGLGDCNGWECSICGKTKEDIASWKMANENNYSNRIVDMGLNISDADNGL